MKACRTLGLLIALGCAMGLAGCKPDAAVRKGEVIGNGTKAPAHPAADEPQSPTDLTPPADAGAVSGTIQFSGKAPGGTIDTSMDPACSLGGGSDRLPVEQYAVKDGKLANVFVYIKSGPSAAMTAGLVSRPPVVMDQRNCQYVPHVIGVVQGGSVEFRNSDPTMHNIHTMPTEAGNGAVDLSEGPHGAAQTRQFAKPELMLPVRCNNHPWMSAFINVSPTPFFAVSDANGRFSISGLPPGTYVLAAVHEKMGERTMQVTVPPKGTARAEFGFVLQG